MGTIDKVTLSGEGVRQLLRSKDVAKHLERLGRRIASAAGPEHEVTSTVGVNRARVTVATTTGKAYGRELHHHTLTQALDAAR